MMHECSTINSGQCHNNLIHNQAEATYTDLQLVRPWHTSIIEIEGIQVVTSYQYLSRFVVLWGVLAPCMLAQSYAGVLKFRVSLHCCQL